MAEAFLEEQLKRIREMSEQMSRVRAFHDVNEGRGPTSDVRRSTETDAPRAHRSSLRGSPRRRGR
jgi:hypothetical protein